MAHVPAYANVTKVCISTPSLEPYHRAPRVPRVRLAPCAGAEPTGGRSGRMDGVGEPHSLRCRIPRSRVWRDAKHHLVELPPKCRRSRMQAKQRSLPASPSARRSSCVATNANLPALTTKGWRATGAVCRHGRQRNAPSSPGTAAPPRGSRSTERAAVASVPRRATNLVDSVLVTSRPPAKTEAEEQVEKCAYLRMPNEWWGDIL